MAKPAAILFAGPAGCSKSPVAFYLSWNLGMPIFSNDVLRTEVSEDLLSNEKDPPEYFKRRDERTRQLLKFHRDFIYDASIDRTWEEKKPLFAEQGYRWFIISFNLSKDLLTKLSKAKGYGGEEHRERWYQEHENFLLKHKDEIDLVIDDNNFVDRLKLSLKAVRDWL